MKIMKKLLSIILALALLIGAFRVPTASAATNDDYIVLEVVSQTNLKEEYYAKSQSIESARPGDLLYAVSAEINKYGNVWYRVLVSNSETADVSEAYAYSGDLVLHECDFLTHVVSEDATLYYCRCGQIQVVRDGVTVQNGEALALNPTGILSPEDIESILAAVAAAKGIAVNAGMKAAGAIKAMTNPYLIVSVMVTGVVVWVALTCDGKTVSIDHVKGMYKNYSDSNLKDGVYYCALVLPDSKSVLFMDIPGTEMDLDGAVAFMTLVAQSNVAYKVERSGERLLFGNIYTPSFTGAQKLCNELTKTGLFYYGGDSGVGTYMSVDKYKIPGAQYYRHYHLYYSGGLANGVFTHQLPTKVSGLHIFWGSPVSVGNAA